MPLTLAPKLSVSDPTVRLEAEATAVTSSIGSELLGDAPVWIWMASELAVNAVLKTVAEEEELPVTALDPEVTLTEPRYDTPVFGKNRV